jgi:transposase InsO family protein
MAKTNMGWLWHRRLAHVGMKNLHKLLKGDHVLGLTDVCFEKDRPCAACQVGKQVGSSHHSKNVMTTSRPLELLHMDLFGPVAYLSIGGSKYGLVIVDDFSCFTWVFFLQDKSETQGTLKRFLRRAQNEFELKVKKIRSDNGSEFKNLQVKEFLEEEGIKHEFSAPYTPQQNGVVERKNRALIVMARTMLGEFKTPERFWSEAVNTACHAINRLYLHRLLKKTSYELLIGNKPNVSYIRVFGSKCYILVKKGRHLGANATFSACRRWSNEFTGGGRQCWGLVLKYYELRTRQHKNKLIVNALRPSKHYLPKGIMIFGRRS